MKTCKTCGTDLADEAQGEFCAKCVLSGLLDGSDEEVGALEDGWLVGKTFGDYEIMEEVARGGMGVVYLARQAGLERIVALKLIQDGALAGRKAINRFQREAAAIAKLDHPNIVPLFEFGEHRRQHYYSMRYLEGGDLASRSRESPPDYRATAELFRKLARALQFAHEQGVLHRDLKPQNILLDRDGEPYLSDFGLARITDADLQLTATREVFGTPEFMAPEQAEGRSEDMGPPTDIYGLGAVLYQTLGGAPPFVGNTSFAVLRQVVEIEPKPLRIHAPGVPADLEVICLKCLRKEPGRRYASAGELADDLEAWLAGRPIRARGENLPYRCRKWMTRSAGKLAVAGSAMVALLSMWWMFVRPNAAPGNFDRGFTISGHGRTIADGQPSADAANGTRFGQVHVGREAVTNYFELRNDGSNALARSTLTNFVFRGPQAGDFAVVTEPTGDLPPARTIRVGVRFAPLGVGERRAQASLGAKNRNDSGYSFEVRGTGVARPARVRSRVKFRVDPRWEGFAATTPYDDEFGASLAVVGDVDGNGVKDLVVGAPGSSVAHHGDGAVWVLMLERDGSVRRAHRIAPTNAIFSGRLGESARLGTGVAAAGDLDQDKHPDICATTATGQVWVLRLTPDGSAHAGELAPMPNLGDTAGHMGITAAGDLNRDGRPDLILAAAGSPTDVAQLALLRSDTSTYRIVRSDSTQAARLLQTFDGSVCVLNDADRDGVKKLALGATWSLEPGDSWHNVLLASVDRLGRVRNYRRLSMNRFFVRDRIGPWGGGGLASAGDLNGDGVEDLLVGSPATGRTRGAVWVALLDKTGTVGQLRLLEPPEASADGDPEPMRFGASVAALGDLDGNGRMEIAVGGPSANGCGAVWILEVEDDLAHTPLPDPGWDLRITSANGERETRSDWVGLDDGTFFGDQQMDEAAETNRFTLENTGSRTISFAGASRPRMLGDHASDFAVTKAPTELRPGESGELSIRFGPQAVGERWARLEFPPAEGGAAAPSMALAGRGRMAEVDDPVLAVGQRSLITAGTDGFLGPLREGDGFGNTVAVIGDVNGDGVADLAVGAKAAKRADDRLWILLLKPDGSVLSASELRWNSPVFAGRAEVQDGLWNALAGPGDVDGDGVPDLLAVAPGDDEAARNVGALWLIHLRSDGRAKSARRLAMELLPSPRPPDETLSGIGRSLALADIDRDGVTDLLLGPSYTPRFRRSLTVVFMQQDWTVREVRRIAPPPTTGSKAPFGHALAVLGDIDADGGLEVAVASVDPRRKGKHWQRILILSLSTAGELIRVQPLTTRDSRTPWWLKSQGQGFGEALANIGDVDGNGVPDLAIGAHAGREGGRVWIACLDTNVQVVRVDRLDPPAGIYGSCEFGSSIAHLPAADENGLGHLVVGARRHSEDELRGGAVWRLELRRRPPAADPIPIPIGNADGTPTLFAWGGDFRGNLGEPKTDRPHSLPLAWQTRAAISSVNMNSSTWIVTAEGRTFGWGGNQRGQLGDGGMLSRSRAEELHFPSGTPPIVKMVTGNTHTLALDAGGGVWGWGASGQYQMLGDEARQSPARIEFFSDKGIAKIGGGFWGGMAIDQAGRLWNWVPKQIYRVAGALDGKPVTAVDTTGTLIRIALTVDGEVYTWMKAADPERVKGPLEHRSVTCIGTSYHSLYAHTADRRTFAWGDNDRGQLGIGSFEDAESPTEITRLRGLQITAIQGGQDHVLMLTADGEVYAMGANGDGQLGNHDWFRDRPRPVKLRLTNVTHIAAGRNTSLAVIRRDPVSHPGDKVISP